MQAEVCFPPPKPQLTWRVGVTGHRALDDGEILAVASAVTEVLVLVRRTLDELAAASDVTSVYALAAARPRLSVISPLADGTDRLVASQAVQHGYRLDVVLPFEREAYVRTFDSQDAGTFEALLDSARSGANGDRILTLDGSADTHRRESYRAIGRYIVRNCDLLIAVWDGEPAAGEGGTADVVDAALAAGLPVWWIDPARPATARLLGQAQAPSTAPQAALVHLIQRAIRPVETARPHAHGSLGWLAQSLDRALGLTGTPLEDYLRETAPGPSRLRGVYAAFLRRIAPTPPYEERGVPQPDGPVEAWWEDHHAKAALLSKTYGDRYRSSYVAVFFLAGLVLISAAIGFVVPPGAHILVASVELAALSAIALLVGANHLYRWQDRWITYRFLAELCRKQRVLAPLGWTLPIGDVTRILSPDDGRISTTHTAPRHDAWVAWYFSAIRRAAPMPSGSLAGPALERVRSVGHGMFQDQQTYHRLRHQRSEMASRRLAHWGDMFFLLALVGVVLRILLEVMHAPGWAGTAIALACFVSPAASATFLGIRAYAEFELLARQSGRMQQVMAVALAELEALPLDGPLASNALGATLVGTTTSMLLDIDGWAQLFQVKAVEAG
ncbi:hypothetical protein [Roseomonas rosulenta]|uniref:hypothetical protein n=1 Tax=Roseomonas rosulenta TaxID=2748667 RepID=UPI0018DF59FE|nr:hypothetical protein [Roseomonas rosulenta]